MLHRLAARGRATRLAIAVTAALLTVGTLPAQDALPKVRLTQMVGAGSIGFGGVGSARLDRDAFLVVLEIGADSRARVVFPASPGDPAFVRADRLVRIPLPSADAAFIRAAELRVPDLVAFASDMAPDLNAFTERGRRWDYQYTVPWSASLEETVQDLATLLYGSADMPYRVETRRLFPQLSTYAHRTLASCGYNTSSPYSPAFNLFLWQSFGPVSVLETSWMIEQRYRNFQWEGPFWFMSAMLPQSFFRRSVGLDLWNTFGAGCDPLQNRFRNVILASGRPGVGTPQSTPPDVTIPVPSDRDPEAKPPIVPGVEIIPTTPEAMTRRGDAVTRVADGRAELRQADARAPEARGPLTRESNYDLVKRQEIATVMAYLTSQRLAGRTGSVMDAFERVRAGQILANGTEATGRQGRLSGPTVNRGAGSSGFGSGIDRAGGGSGGFGGSGSVGASGGAGAGVGSGSMSGGSEARGGEARGGGGGRGSGTGRP
jgi:hypothetical protein